MTEVLNQDTQNKIIRFLFEKHGVRGEIMQMDTPCFKLLEHHNYPLSVKQLLIHPLVFDVFGRYKYAKKSGK